MRFFKLSRRSLFALAGLGTLLVAGGAFARHGFHHRHDPERFKTIINWKVDDVLDDINATDDQRAKINAVKDRLFEEGVKAHGDRDAMREKLMQAWLSDNPDREMLRNLANEKHAAMQAMADKFIDGAIEVHAVLTPEQRKQVAQRFERFGPHMMEGGHHGK